MVFVESGFVVGVEYKCFMLFYNFFERSGVEGNGISFQYLIKVGVIGFVYFSVCGEILWWWYKISGEFFDEFFFGYIGMQGIVGFFLIVKCVLGFIVYIFVVGRICIVAGVNDDFVWQCYDFFMQIVKKLFCEVFGCDFISFLCQVWVAYIVNEEGVVGKDVVFFFFFINKQEGGVFWGVAWGVEDFDGQFVQFDFFVVCSYVFFKSCFCFRAVNDGGIGFFCQVDVFGNKVCVEVSFENIFQFCFFFVQFVKVGFGFM